jgi:hypothetical protein
MYFKYLDFPAIPDYLLKTAPEHFLGEKNIFRIPTYKYYKQYEVGNELVEYLQSIIPYPFHSSYQVIRNGLDIHKDGARTECINYIISTGGINSALNIYNEDKQIIYSEKIEPLRWHWINVGMFHNVTNIDNTRISISLNVFNKSFK